MRSSKADRFALSIVEELRKSCNLGTARIRSFIKYNRQVEGWFKGELLKIAADMEKENVIKSFHPDCRISAIGSKQNIDLVYTLHGGKRIWIELKHWYLGKYASGARWSATNYFTQKTSGTVYNVVNKIPPEWSDPLYMLVVTTPRPEHDDWQSGISRFRESNRDKTITCLTRLSDFPDHYFLALLRF